MFCGNCGSKLEGNEIFCGHCGSSTNSNNLGSQVQSQSQLYSNTYASFGQRLGAYFIDGLVAIGISIGIFLYVW